MPARRKLAAYTVPFLAFVALLALNGVCKKIDGRLWLTLAEYWIYPAQTFLCGALLVRFAREYDVHRLRRAGFAVLIAVVTFALWISPQTVLGFSPRIVGFNPLLLFNQQSPLYWLELVLRFARLLIIVPFVEEIFWRGFLLRFLIDEKFQRVRFGTFSWLSFAAVSLAFAFSHAKADWPAAFVTGILYNVVAYRTKSLSTCVLTHAITNLLLGLWIMATGQWGFW